MCVLFCGCFVVVVCLGEFSMFCFLFWIGERGGGGGIFIKSTKVSSLPLACDTIE